MLKPGKLWLYKDQSPWVLNFPTKDHWRYPSKELYLRVGLINFVETYKKRGITSVAFPLLGADKGGIDKDVSKSIMKEYLSGLDIDIEIYEYDPNATDPLYLEIQEWILSANLTNLSEKTGISLKYLILINDSMMRKEIHQVGQILSIKGIGTHSVEKLLDYKFNQPQNLQISLF
ncbi:macro domain-containing protein [Psychrobacter sp. Ps2]|uniref:macro domain-containing protein n=1 Tax=Psychrobacter sp. Ps2 TaxID=2790956 RepID=UPI001EDCBD7F|nr:macro domain-containing protein [Psychrobacter sp. Ps2]MCG3857992.1 macro domain-containing protein [Psychrobacter sp. Ps2]